MLGVIIVLITFVLGQWMAHRFEWIKQRSLLTLLLLSIVCIACSICIVIVTGIQSPFVIIVPTILSATCLSAKYRFTSMALLQRLKEMQKHEA
ncbi:hypothetical protein BAMA_24075 [Bacillus manliponensis]|uniref:Group-specific protein n=1 Tax=Bacillus manliponensis TaxID=574376 RepID=A0A073K9Z7_9BACI|nr:hypothetical protein [Bacillus manliponensis]KEK19093.1 hypothetical protein BAMA_24075 [Bacillus manliponensis]